MALASTQVTISSKNSVSAIPNWRSGKSDPRSRDIRLSDAYFNMEHRVGKGQKPDVTRNDEAWIHSDSFTYLCLLKGLCSEGMLEGALRILQMLEEDVPGPDLENYNALMLGLCKAQRKDLSFKVIERMMEKGKVPNEASHTIFVEVLAHENEMELGVEVLRELLQKQVISHNTAERLVMQFDLQGIPI